MLAPLEPPRPHPLLPTPLQVRWNNKKVKFREHTFLQNPLVPAALVLVPAAASDCLLAESMFKIPQNFPSSDVPWGVRLSTQGRIEPAFYLGT